MSSHYNKNADEKRKTRAARRIDNATLRTYTNYVFEENEFEEIEDENEQVVENIEPDNDEALIKSDNDEALIKQAWAMYDAEKAQKDAEAARIKEEQEAAMFAELAAEKDAQANCEDENPEF